MNVLNKQVTLPKGAVVVPIRLAIVNGKPDPTVLVCEDRNNNLHYVLRSTIEQLPVTYNRNEVVN